MISIDLVVRSRPGSTGIAHVWNTCAPPACGATVYAPLRPNCCDPQRRPCFAVGGGPAPLGSCGRRLSRGPAGCDRRLVTTNVASSASTASCAPPLPVRTHPRLAPVPTLCASALSTTSGCPRRCRSGTYAATITRSSLPTQRRHRQAIQPCAGLIAAVPRSVAIGAGPRHRRSGTRVRPGHAGRGTPGRCCSTSAATSTVPVFWRPSVRA